MPLSPLEVLDLHWKSADAFFETESEGVLCKDMNDIIERISKVKNTVKKLNLNNQQALTEIPDIIKECKLIEELNISHTKVAEIPDFLFEVPALRVLSCCCKEVPQPPEGLAKAVKLEKLHIRINDGWSFPEEISSLSELKIILIDVYSPSAVLKDVKNLNKLEEMSMSIKYEQGDALNLPDSFSNHPALKRISIFDNVYKNYKKLDFDQTARILSSCKELESLTLSCFTIDSHKALSKISRLKKLELRHLHVDGNIFNSIESLQNLEKLGVMGSEFKIEELPDIFNNLRALHSFSFAGNFIRKLPPSLFNLSNLTTLEIGATGISAIDEKIENLKNLTTLHIYDNMLEKLPNSIFTLPKLAVLNIEENFFKHQDITAIKQKLAALSKNGQKIEFICGRQGHRLPVKKLRALNYFESINSEVYYKYCMAAVCEKSNALKYIRDEFLKDSHYRQVCLEAALRNSYADFLDNINHKRLRREDYERICWASILHFPATISKMIEPTEELLAIVSLSRG
jgi:Leucine-rich repeat (LRR) protein